MGNWVITVHGVGAHHNFDGERKRNVPYDADLMTREFVGKLKEAGHTVKAATFSHGGDHEDVANGQA